MDIDSLIQKAAGLLDQPNGEAAAAATLREAVALADDQNDDALGGEARVFLAEMLVQDGTEPGRTEAKALLEAALRLASRTTLDPDLVGPWRLAASELLLELEASAGPTPPRESAL